jgi:hypothetical protein
MFSRQRRNENLASLPKGPALPVGFGGRPALAQPVAVFAPRSKIHLKFRLISHPWVVSRSGSAAESRRSPSLQKTNAEAFFLGWVKAPEKTTTGMRLQR